MFRYKHCGLKGPSLCCAFLCSMYSSANSTKAVYSNMCQGKAFQSSYKHLTTWRNYMGVKNNAWTCSLRFHYELWHQTAPTLCFVHRSSVCTSNFKVHQSERTWVFFTWLDGAYLLDKLHVYSCVLTPSVSNTQNALSFRKYIFFIHKFLVKGAELGYVALQVYSAT